MSTAGKKAICLYFQVHQPFRLKRYRFFDLGHDHYYYDDFSNESIMRKVAQKCYLPANKIIMELIQKHKEKFKVTFSLSGIVINQFRLYAPEVLESFRQLAQTGMVEFLSETDSHSLASLRNRTQFEQQVQLHREMVKTYLGVETTSFRNTELIYNDTIGSWVADMGFKSILTEGAKHILGWKSPNYLYCNAINPRLKVLLRNFVMSDDIAFRFSNKSWSAWPLTADKYATWISKLAPKSELLNIFLDYETFGEHNWKETGIFDFLQHLPGAILKKTPFKFMTPSEVAETLQPVSAINVPSSISWADEERDITAWLGNELQLAAFEKLYELSDKVSRCNDEQMRIDWEYLQSSDHFYYMATKFFSDGAVHAYFNPYETPYDAFMNYMNVLSDFEIRLNRQSPDTHEQRQILKLDNQILEKDLVIEKLTAEIQKLNEKRTKILGEDLIIPEKGGKTSLKDLAHQLITVSAEEQPPRNASSGTKKEKTKIVKKTTAKKTTAKKTTAKKATTGKTVKKKSTAVKSRKIKK